MWFAMRPVELAFLDEAPSRFVVDARLRAPRQAVWDAFVDPGTWPRWFPGVREVVYRGARPYGVGTRRAATVGRQRYEETLLAWDEGVRWAYRVDRATLPLARAQLECTDFEDDGSGTRVRWTLAAEPRSVMRLASPFLPGVLHRLLRRAALELDTYLGA